jgi:hypothetical protein
MKAIWKKVVIVCASLALLAGASFVFPATQAYAGDPYLDSNVPSEGMTDKDIALMYEHEIAWLISQRAVLRDVRELYDTYHVLIDAQVTKRGEDAAAPLHDGSLGQFATAIFDAQTVHDQAATVIGAGFGFDAKGKVTNREAALRTVTEGRYNLRDVHFRLVIGVRDIKRAYAAWFVQFHP